MLGMGRLKTAYMLAEFRFMKPFGNEPAQSPPSFRYVIMRVAVERVAGKRRRSLARDDEHQTTT